MFIFKLAAVTFSIYIGCILHLTLLNNMVKLKICIENVCKTAEECQFLNHRHLLMGSEYVASSYSQSISQSHKKFEEKQSASSDWWLCQVINGVVGKFSNRYNDNNNCSV